MPFQWSSQDKYLADGSAPSCTKGQTMSRSWVVINKLME